MEVVAGTAVTHAGTPAVAGQARARFDAAWQVRRSDPVTSIEVARELREVAVAAGDLVAAGRALTLIGACQALQNDFIAAYRALVEALNALADGPGPDLARALSEAGFVDYTLGDHASAIERLRAALALYDRDGDRAGALATLNRIGVAFFDHGDLDEAGRSYRRCLSISQYLGTGCDPLSVAGLHNNLAKVLTAQGDFDAALDHLAAARDGFEAAGEARGLGMVTHNVAVVHERRGELPHAVELLRRAIDHYDASGHVHGACEARTRLGAVLHALGELSGAAVPLHRAHDDAEVLGLRRECAAAAEVLVDLHDDHGEPAEALAWLRHLRQLERELFKESSERRLRSLQVRHQLEQFEHDSVTDALTGLLNRRGLERALTDQVRRAREAGEDLAVLLLDLDDFKRVNDDFSHAVGDEVLRALASLLRKGIRPTDICARYGGEEFVVVLPGCGRARAHEIASELVVAIRAFGWTSISSRLAVTSSIGAATLAEVGAPELLLDVADRALYAAKHGGKDRVRSAS